VRTATLSLALTEGNVDVACCKLVKERDKPTIFAVNSFMYNQAAAQQIAWINLEMAKMMDLMLDHDVQPDMDLAKIIYGALVYPCQVAGIHLAVVIGIDLVTSAIEEEMGEDSGHYGSMSSIVHHYKMPHMGETNPPENPWDIHSMETQFKNARSIADRFSQMFANRKNQGDSENQGGRPG
jgi:hypothetical protein